MNVDLTGYGRRRIDHRIVGRHGRQHCHMTEVAGGSP
jgi:hypothetical protein